MRCMLSFQKRQEVSRYVLSWFLHFGWVCGRYCIWLFEEVWGTLHDVYLSYFSLEVMINLTSWHAPNSVHSWTTPEPANQISRKVLFMITCVMYAK